MNARQREIAVLATGLSSIAVGLAILGIVELVPSHTLRIIGSTLMFTGVFATPVFCGYVLIRDLWRASS